MCGVCFFLSESRVPFSNYAVATTVIWIDNQGQRKNGRKLGGETLLPLLVGKDESEFPKIPLFHSYRLLFPKHGLTNG
jgi:hypothetical protein